MSIPITLDYVKCLEMTRKWQEILFAVYVKKIYLLLICFVFVWVPLIPVFLHVPIVFTQSIGTSKYRNIKVSLYTLQLSWSTTKCLFDLQLTQVSVCTNDELCSSIFCWFKMKITHTSVCPLPILLIEQFASGHNNIWHVFTSFYKCDSTAQAHASQHNNVLYTWIVTTLTVT